MSGKWTVVLNNTNFKNPYVRELQAAYSNKYTKSPNIVFQRESAKAQDSAIGGENGVEKTVDDQHAESVFDKAAKEKGYQIRVSAPAKSSNPKQGSMKQRAPNRRSELPAQSSGSGRLDSSLNDRISSRRSKDASSKFGASYPGRNNRLSLNRESDKDAISPCFQLAGTPDSQDASSGGPSSQNHRNDIAQNGGQGYNNISKLLKNRLQNPEYKNGAQIGPKQDQDLQLQQMEEDEQQNKNGDLQNNATEAGRDAAWSGATAEQEQEEFGKDLDMQDNEAIQMSKPRQGRENKAVSFSRVLEESQDRQEPGGVLDIFNNSMYGSGVQTEGRIGHLTGQPNQVPRFHAEVARAAQLYKQGLDSPARPPLGPTDPRSNIVINNNYIFNVNQTTGKKRKPHPQITSQNKPSSLTPLQQQPGKFTAPNRRMVPSVQNQAYLAKVGGPSASTKFINQHARPRMPSPLAAHRQIQQKLDNYTGILAASDAGSSSQIGKARGNWINPRNAQAPRLGPYNEHPGTVKPQVRKNAVAPKVFEKQRLIKSQQNHRKIPEPQMITKKAPGMPYVMSSYGPNSYAPPTKGISRARQVIAAKKERIFNTASKPARVTALTNGLPSKSLPSTPDKHSDNSAKIGSPETENKRINQNDNEMIFNENEVKIQSNCQIGKSNLKEPEKQRSGQKNRVESILDESSKASNNESQKQERPGSVDSSNVITSLKELFDLLGVQPDRCFVYHDQKYKIDIKGLQEGADTIQGMARERMGNMQGGAEEQNVAGGSGQEGEKAGPRINVESLCQHTEEDQLDETKTPVPDSKNAAPIKDEGDNANQQVAANDEPLDTKPPVPQKQSTLLPPTGAPGGPRKKEQSAPQQTRKHMPSLQTNNIDESLKSHGILHSASSNREKSSKVKEHEHQAARLRRNRADSLHGRESAGSRTDSQQALSVHREGTSEKWHQIGAAEGGPDQVPLLLQNSEVPHFRSQRTEDKPITVQHSSVVAQTSTYQRRNIHFAFLFASPLVLKTSENQYHDVLQPIGFSEEFAQIKRSMEEKGNEFAYRLSLATATNLKKALRDNPIGLHFSGHGFLNTEKLYRKDNVGYRFNRNKGDVLIFEDENGTGASEFFFTSQLKSLIDERKQEQIYAQQQALGIQPQNTLTDNAEESKGTAARSSTPPNNQEAAQEQEPVGLASNSMNLQFVFVASCQSEEWGIIFKDAGIPHVICIRKKDFYKDKVAIEFSKYFYDEVFDQYKNICQAFAAAKARVQDTFGLSEANKLILLINDQAHPGTCEQNDERLQQRAGRVHQVNVEPHTIVLPNKVTPFLFRGKDMFETLKSLADNNIVQIYGMPGLGKSSLLKNATCFLGERNIYKDGIVYIDLHGVSTFKDTIQIVNAYVVGEDEGNDHCYDIEREEDEITREVDKLKNKVQTFKKFLLSIDNAHHLQNQNHGAFLKFINEIAAPNFKILFTSNKFQINHFVEKFVVKKVEKLKNQFSIDLFINKIPLSEEDKRSFLDYENTKELHRLTKVRYGEKSDFIPSLCRNIHKEHNLSCTKEYLSKHPLIEFMGGIPLVISMMAVLSVQKSLAEIFLYLAEKNDANFQSEVLQKGSRLDDYSLIICLEYCTQYFESKESAKIRDLWYMIGLQGPGILYEDLKTIYCFENEINIDIIDEDEMKTNLNPSKITESGEEEEEGELISVEKLDAFLDELKTLSCIEEEKLDKLGEVRRYRVSPFVDTYIQKKMAPGMKKIYLETICTLLNTKIIGLKEDYARKIKDCKTIEEYNKLLESVQERIKPYEIQIMHVVQQLFDIHQSLLDAKKKPNQNQDQEEKQNDNQEIIKLQKTEGEENNMDEKAQRFITQGSAGVPSQERAEQERRAKKARRERSGSELHVSSMAKWGRSTFVGKSANNPQQLPSQAPPAHQDQMLTQLTGECSAPYKKSTTGGGTFDERGQKEKPAHGCADGPHGGAGSKKEEEDEDAAEENDSPFAGVRSGPGSPQPPPQIEERRAESEDDSFGTESDLEEDEGSPAGKDLQGMEAKRSRDERYEAEDLLAESADADVSEVQQEINDRDDDADNENEEISEALDLELRDRQRRFSERKKGERLAAPDPHLLVLPSQSSTSSAQMQQNLSPLKIAQMYHPQLCGDDCADISHLTYHFGQNNQSILSPAQEPSPMFLSKFERKETKRYLQKLDPVAFDAEHLKRQTCLRRSILGKSFSRGRGGSLLYKMKDICQANPDLQGASDVGGLADDAVDFLLASDYNLTAGPAFKATKLNSAGVLLNQPNLIKCKSGYPLQLELKINEELFFNFLCILALLPSKRSDLRKIQEQVQSHDERRNLRLEELKTDANFNMVEQAEKRLKKFKTAVEIPDEAKLLMANCMLLELYDLLMVERLAGAKDKKPHHVAKSDAIFERADEMREFFTQLQFGRGLAILDYLQSIRLRSKLGNLKEFKTYLYRAATGFAESHEIDGVKQCLEQADRYLGVHDTGQQKDDTTPSYAIKDQAFVDGIKAIHSSLESTEDETIQGYINYRQQIKINGLSARLIDASKLPEKTRELYRIGQGPDFTLGSVIATDDLVLNMLLNPQHHLTLHKQ